MFAQLHKRVECFSLPSPKTQRIHLLWLLRSTRSRRYALHSADTTTSSVRSDKEHSLPYTWRATSLMHSPTHTHKGLSIATSSRKTFFFPRDTRSSPISGSRARSMLRAFALLPGPAPPAQVRLLT